MKSATLSNLAGGLSIETGFNGAKSFVVNFVNRTWDGGLFNYTTLNGYRGANTENNREYGAIGRYGYSSYTSNDIIPTDSVVLQGDKLTIPVLPSNNIGNSYRVPLRGEVIGAVKGFTTIDEFTYLGSLLRGDNIRYNTTEDTNKEKYGENSAKFSVENYRKNVLPDAISFYTTDIPKDEIGNEYYVGWDIKTKEQHSALNSEENTNFLIAALEINKREREKVGRLNAFYEYGRKTHSSEHPFSKYGFNEELRIKAEEKEHLYSLEEVADTERKKYREGKKRVQNKTYTFLNSYGYNTKEKGEENYSVDSEYYAASDHKIDRKFTDGVMSKPTNNGNRTYEYFREIDGGAIPMMNADSTSLSSAVKHGSFDNVSPLLQKTNEYFKSGRIQSLVNRFHSSKVNGDELITAFDSVYGISRGRNLLKKERDGGDTGYNNPYCRVWTAHHQYARLRDRIRPFYNDDGPMSTRDLHKTLGNLRTADGAEKLSNRGVLRDDGFVQITPEYNSDGTFNKNIKDYMFSIENLAWKDVKATCGLNESQIGENNGRIMWFPPYNLKFTENVNTNWNSHNFIGRGEQIYTYVNTERAGTLSFTLLIDHPSIINKWRGRSEEVDNKKERQDDLLRFFAGCGTLDGTLSGQEQKTPDEDNKKNDDTTPKVTPKTKDIAYVMFFPNDFSAKDYDDNIKIAIDKIKEYEVTGKNEKWTERDEKYKDEILNVDNVNNKDSKYKLNVGPSEDNVKKVIRDALFDGNEDIEIRYFIGDEKLTLVGNRENYNGGLSSERGLGGTSIFDFDDNNCEIISIKTKGFASSHGYIKNNIELCDRRAAFIEKVLKYKSAKVQDDKITRQKGQIISVKKIGPYDDINALDAKISRAAYAIFSVAYKDNITPINLPSTDDIVAVANGAQINDKPQTYEDNPEFIGPRIAEETEEIPTADYTYDSEYLYFSNVKKDEMVYKNIIDKIKFFDPAFHSVTPEGFNARLTFLHQCTRQGPTSAVSSGNVDEGSNAYQKYAGNLAFGRAPYCILRIGDFFHTKICIDSIQIDYDNGGGIQWDLNPEGVGVQPMYANINISFKFIGGQDLNNPIERLQNAITANYYANASVYDRTANPKYNGGLK